MAQATEDFSGTWYCWHWYPSKDDSSEEVSRNRMRAHQKGRNIVLESEPNEEGSYLFVKLSIDDNVAAGTWYETSSPTGDWHSATYSGAGQLVIDEDGQEMDGKWAGMGYDHHIKKPRVYTGRWRLARNDRKHE